MNKRILPFIVGPTACMKTAVAVEAALLMGAEIISLDSMKVYRGMDILTAKPDADERRGVRYHLLDVVEASEPFSTARYIAHALKAVEEIESRSKAVLFEGGTALYLKALTEGLFEGPDADWDLRNRLRGQADRHGADVLHNRLKEVDPAAAARIHPNDLRRVIRALEVYEITGRPLSKLQEELTRALIECERRIAVLHTERATLRRRISERVDRMVEAGLVGEVARLHAAGVSREASQALGYKELVEHVEGRATLDEAVDRIKTETMRFAKKQMTFFRSFPDAVWIELPDTPQPAETARRVVGAWGLGLEGWGV
jgi:tRNA dimethylallyltransferase